MKNNNTAPIFEVEFFLDSASDAVNMSFASIDELKNFEKFSKYIKTNFNNEDHYYDAVKDYMLPKSKHGFIVGGWLPVYDWLEKTAERLIKASAKAKTEKTKTFWIDAGSNGKEAFYVTLKYNGRKLSTINEKLLK